ncbi:transporter [Sulfitobacter sp. SK012]|uniref:TolC family outer membrane protein n=1 Tax=Sulfitobacter sp. SK012 TaxID=1389005 RepID=UPI000E0CB3C6|nr:TolC family outer membrane protein [Sulfitobacter sp. SK012]AXI45855.1 transporter [Sulfitobacter sp. SK012]
MKVMNVRKQIGRAIAAGTICVGLAVPAQADTLADALVGAYTHSGLLDQNRALLRAADEDVAIANSALKPIISWSADITQTFGRSRSAVSVLGRQNINNTEASISLIADLLVYDFGATAFGIEATKETVLATRDTLLAIEQDVLLRAVAAFMGVIEAYEFVELADNNQRVLAEELRAAQNRFEVGEVTRTDVALAEAQLASARSNQANAKGNLQISIEEYRNVVGRKPGRLSALPRLPNLGGDVEAAKGIAVRFHPSLRAVQHQVAAAELRIRQAEANMKPTIGLEGRLSVIETLDTDAYQNQGVVGLNIGGPIYRGGLLSAQVRQATANRDAQRGNLHRVRHDIQQGVGQSYAQLDSARASLAATAEQIRAARIAFQGVREEATLGARTTLDVLDAEQSLLDAEAARISAQSQLYISAYSVLSSKGQLTARDLGLPVQIYDPAEYYNLVKDSPTNRSKQGQQLDRVLRKLQKN